MNQILKVIAFMAIIGCGQALQAVMVDPLVVKKAEYELARARALVHIHVGRAQAKVDKAYSNYISTKSGTKWSWWPWTNPADTPEGVKSIAEAGIKHVKAQQEAQQVLFKGYERIREKKLALQAAQNPSVIQHKVAELTTPHTFFTTWQGAATLCGAAVTGYMLWRAGKEGLQCLIDLDPQGFWNAFIHEGRSPRYHTVAASADSSRLMQAMMTNKRQSAAVSGKKSSGNRRKQAPVVRKQTHQQKAKAIAMAMARTKALKFKKKRK